MCKPETAKFKGASYSTLKVTTESGGSITFFFGKEVPLLYGLRIIDAVRAERRPGSGVWLRTQVALLINPRARAADRAP
jgi:hypothetical protein